MTNRSRRLRRVKHRNNNTKDRFIFTNDLNLIEPFADYHICIENFISRFGPNDIVLYNSTERFLPNKHTR